MNIFDIVLKTIDYVLLGRYEKFSERECDESVL